MSRAFRDLLVKEAPFEDIEEKNMLRGGSSRAAGRMSRGAALNHFASAFASPGSAMPGRAMRAKRAAGFLKGRIANRKRRAFVAGALDRYSSEGRYF